MKGSFFCCTSIITCISSSFFLNAFCIIDSAFMFSFDRLHFVSQKAVVEESDQFNRRWKNITLEKKRQYSATGVIVEERYNSCALHLFHDLQNKNIDGEAL